MVLERDHPSAGPALVAPSTHSPHQEHSWPNGSKCYVSNGCGVTSNVCGATSHGYGVTGNGYGVTSDVVPVLCGAVLVLRGAVLLQHYCKTTVTPLFSPRPE